MKGKIRMWKAIACIGVMLILSADGFSSNPDSLVYSHRFIHKIALEGRPGYVFPTNAFFRGENARSQRINTTLSAHLKYAFQFCPGTRTDRIYSGVYQGIGLAYYTFDNKKELGNPIALYLYQGARIKRLNPQLSLNYEWNFGVSFGWVPYDYQKNYYNSVIGSKVNAYINANFYLSWMLSHQFDLTTGVALSHFSNGNTKFPNSGLNTLALKVGLVYNFNRDEQCLSNSIYKPFIPVFPRHVSYDLVLFGSWRRKGVLLGDERVASPHVYTVVGFNFAPMYNIGYKFRIGVSLDGVYDGSANVYTKDHASGTSYQFYTPSLDKQLALGLSGRAEYVMPYFTVGLGLGTNVLHAGGDMKSFYQILALKIELTRSSFLHIGYSLHNFHEPSYLMLGIGYRFNNKYPTFHR